ncbi:MAG TPA: VOC family protein [Gemmataceae bacterium]|nr:VOC family protein [Gemmataceae bacterium]
MSKQVNPIPSGYHTITPYLIVRGAAQAIDFYKRAFGAEEVYRLASPDGQSIWHAEVRIGNSMLMLSEECSNGRSPASLGGTPVHLYVYVEDVDKVFERAVAAGATVIRPPTDMFYGDRFCELRDPFGHAWGLATHKEDVPPEELAKRAAALMTPGTAT